MQEQWTKLPKSKLEKNLLILTSNFSKRAQGAYLAAKFFHIWDFYTITTFLKLNSDKFAFFNDPKWTITSGDK